MPPTYEIRADYDDATIVVYQAYAPEIARSAVEAQRFVPPFSLNRMTWIKPSFLWMMERSNWGQKPGQEHVLAVRITRAGWESALSQAVLTHPERGIYRDSEDWEQQLKRSPVRVQWDPERTLRGSSLEYRSIQVGLSRDIIRAYVEEWTVSITDLTPRVRKMYSLINGGKASKANEMLPKERPYPLPPDIVRQIGMSSEKR
jgi:hypothetical protein